MGDACRCGYNFQWHAARHASLVPGTRLAPRMSMATYGAGCSCLFRRVRHVRDVFVKFSKRCDSHRFTATEGSLAIPLRFLSVICCLACGAGDGPAAGQQPPAARMRQCTMLRGLRGLHAFSNHVLLTFWKYFARTSF